MKSRTRTPVHRKTHRRILTGSIALLTVAALFPAPRARATTVWLDTSGGTAGLLGGAATWDAGTTAVWTIDPTGASPTSLYTSGADVIFNTTSAPTVTVNGTVSADSLTFQSAFAATINNGTSGLITLGGGATPGIFVLGSDTTATTINTALSLAAGSSTFSFTNAGIGLLTIGQITGSATTGTQVITVSSTNTGGITLNNTIADGAGGGTVGLVINDPASGVTTLSGANTFSGGILVRSGTLTSATSAGGSAYGNSTVTLGDTAANPLGVTLGFGGTQGAYANNIVLNSGTTGGIKLSSANASTAVALSGTITGSNSFTISESSTATWNLSGLVNNAGAIANVSAGAGGITFSGGIGSSVTAITEASTTSALSITNTLSVNSAGTTLTNSAGTAIFVVSGGVSGTGNLVLANNSATANGIQLTTSSVNNAGGVTNSGTGTGASLISAVIGSSVTGGVFQQSATSALTLNNANTFTGPLTVAEGSLTLNGAAGAASGTTAVSVLGGGTFTLGDATAGNGLANRVNSGATLTLGNSTGGGILSVVRGSTTANSQSFASLTVGGASSIVNSGTTGGVPTVTFTGAAPYSRTVGGLVNLTSGANLVTNFTNVPSGAGNVSNNILIGAVQNSNDFVQAAAGNLAVPTYTAATTTTWGGATADTQITGLTSTVSGATTNSLLFTPTGVAPVASISGANTLVSGGILVQGAGTTAATISGTGSLTTGQAGGDIWVYTGGHSLTISAILADNATSGLTFGGSQALTLSGANTFLGDTTVQGTQLNLSTASANGTTVVAIPGNLNITGTGATASLVVATASNEIANTAVLTIGGSAIGAGNRYALGATFNQTLAGLQTSTFGTGAIIEAADTGTTVGTSTLTLNNTANDIFDGSFRNTGSTVTVLAFTKNGAGKFTLENTAGLNGTGYTGATTINAGTLALVDSGNGKTIGSFASAVTVTSPGVLELDNTSAATAETFGNVIAGTGVVNINAGTSAIVLTKANTLSTGGINVNTGTLRVTTVATALGASTNPVTVASGAALDVGFALTNTNPLTINGAGPTGFGSLTDSSAIGTYAGAVTLGGASTIGTSSTFALTVGGTVTGSQPLTLNIGSSGGLTLTNVNNSGSVTNSGLGTGTATITTLGTNVTTLAQAGNSPLTITNAVTPSATMNTFTSTGLGLETLTGGIGSGSFNLTFNANANGGMTVGAISSTGTISNSGTGTGIVTISGVIGTTVTNVLQNSTGTLILSNAGNAYTGTTTVQQGTLSFSGTPATGSTSGLGNSSTAIVLGGATTKGTLVYTGSAATMTRNVTINAGGAEIDSTTGTLTINPGSIVTPAAIDLTNGPLTLGGAKGITLGVATASNALLTGTNSLTINGSGGTFVLNTLGGTAAIQSAMPINLQAGTLSFITTNVTTNNELGTGPITITPGATLTGSYTGNTASSMTNAITVAAASGTANITTTSGTVNFNTGGVTFAAGSTAATILKLNNTNSTAASLLIGGAISGTGSIQLNPSSTASAITLSGAQNQTGSITDVGSSSSTATLSGPIGAGITVISQAGSNPFTVSSAIPLATLNSFTSTGSGLFTFSGGFGTAVAQPLTFNANSTGGITISSASPNNAGTITNSGTGLGVTTISAAVGANVTNVIENSVTSPLVLSGSNTAYANTYTATSGVLEFATTTALTGYPASPSAVKVSIASGGVLGFAYGSTGQLQASDITTLINGAGTTYANLSFAATGASVGLDTGLQSASFTSVLADAPAASLGLVKLGLNTLTLGTTNTFSGPVWVQNGALSVGSLNNVSSPGPLASSSLGAPTSVANGTISLGILTNSGVLSYTGPGETTDRVINLAGTTGGGTIDQSGTGALTLTGNMTFTGTGAKTLTLSGSTAAAGIYSGTIAGGGLYYNVSASSSPLTITKSGTGTWTLSGTGNTATELIMSGGILDIGANGLTLADTTAAGAGNAVVANTGSATINGTGGGALILSSGNAATDGGNFGTASGTTLTVNVPIQIPTTGNFAGESGAFEKYDGATNATGVVILNAVSTYTGNTLINSGTLQVSSIGNQGSITSSLGSGTSIVFGTSSNSTLQYTGPGETSTRIINLGGTTSGGILDQSGTGTLTFSSNLVASGAGIKALTLQGSTAGVGVFSGAIVDNSTTNTTGVTKAGLGQWTLSGLNTYTGPTAVTAGNLVMSRGGGTGALANTAITVSSGATLTPLAGFTVGNIATAAKGGTLILNSGSTLNLSDGTIGSFTLVQNSTFTGNAATFNNTSLSFDIGSTVGSNDAIVVSLNNVAGTGQATSAGSSSIAITPATGVTNLASGSYTLINAAAAGSTLTNANFYLASPNLLLNGILYNLSLSGTTGTEVLTVATGSAAAAPNAAFWTGAQGAAGTGSWATGAVGGVATNWATSAAGSTDTAAVPGSLTNVTMTANAATNLSTTLDQSFIINSLTFSGALTANAAGATIASGAGGPNTLTINAAAVNGATAGIGLTSNVGAGPDTVSAGVILGASQTWANNSTSLLNISGVVDDGVNIFNLTIAGTGTTTLSNAANTYGGITTINSGTLGVTAVNNGGVASSIGESSNSAANLVFNGGTLLYGGTTSVSGRAFTINPGITATIDVVASASLSLAGATGAVSTGGLTKVDNGTLVLTGANTYTGNTTVNGGALTIGSTGSLTGNGITTAGSQLVVTSAANQTAVLNVAGNINSYFAYTGANNLGDVSVYNQTGGTVTTTTNLTSNATNFVAGNGGYGYFNITGGTFNNSAGRMTVATSSVATNPGTVGVIYVGGTGTLVSNTEYFLIAYADTNDIGEVTVGPGGTFNRNGSADPLVIYWTNPGETGILNVTGGLLTTTAGKGIVFGNAANSAGNLGFVNFDAGTWQTNAALAVSTNTGPSGAFAYMTAAGGTITTTGAIAGIFPASATGITAVTKIFGAINNSAATGDNSQNFTGGLTINTGAFNSSLSQVLNGATGAGVYAANLNVTGGSGYVGAPAVTFTGGTLAAGGIPASGYALISNGAVTGIVITNPGEYTVAPTLTLSGGGTGASISINALIANSNSGGLTKQGSGTLTISVNNTFGGVVDIQGGILATPLLANGGSPSGIGESSNAASNVLLDGGILSYTSTTTAGVTDRNFTLSASGGGLDASGTVAAATLTLTAANNIVVAPNLGAVTMILQGSGTAATGAGFFGSQLGNATGTTVGLTKQGAGQWTITNSANTYSGPTVLGGGILSVSKLDIGGNSSSIGASSNAAANLVFSGGTLLYTGAGATTDRNFTFGNATTAAGGGIDNEGTGPLVINGSMTAVNAAAGTQILTLTAAAGTGTNLIDGVVDSNTGSGFLTGLTKTGLGSWTIGGSSNYSGATTLTAGTLQYAGSSALQGATAIGMAAATTLQIRDDASGTISHIANNITVTSAGTVTVDVGNNGGATTGSTVAFGALNNGTSANAFATTVDFTGANGYSQSYTNLALPGSTGQTTTLVPTTTSVTIVGNVTNQITTVATHFDTLTLDGTSTGNAIGGVIADNAGFTSVGNGDTRITKSNSSTWALNGLNTYHGPTAINGGTLILGSTGGLGNTAISVAATATFNPQPGSGSVTAGNNLTAAQGATLNVAANGTVSLVDGAIGTFNLVQNSTFATAALTLASANINLEIGSAGADQIVVSGGSVSSAISGTSIINFTGVGGSLTPGTYNLLSAPGIAAGNTLFKFSNGTAAETLSVGAFTYPLSLTSVAGVEKVTVGTGFGNLTWTGQTNGTGAANSVWIATPSGNNNFATTVPAAADYTDGSAITFQDANTIASANVTNSLVTIDSAGVSPGSVVVNNSAVNYTFSNASGSIGIQGATGLTKTGSGTLTLLGQNTYTGLTVLNGGIVSLGVADNGTTAGPLGATTGGGVIVFGGGILQYTMANTTDYSARFGTGPNNLINIDTNGQNVIFAAALTSTGGTLTKNGAGTLTLTTNFGVTTYTGATVINGGTLKLTGTGGAAGILAGTPTITVNNGGTLLLQNATSSINDMIGFTAGKEALIINFGGTVLENTTTGRQTLLNTTTMTGGTLGGTSAGAGIGAYSIDNAAGFIATSDASGNPSVINPVGGIALQVANVTFNVSRGAATPASDLNITTPVVNYTSIVGTLTKMGNGIMTLSGASTYGGATGATVILGGTIVAGNATSSLGATANALTFGDGTTVNSGTLDLSSNGVTEAALTVKTTTTSATANVDTILVGSAKTLTTTGAVTVGVGAATTNFTNLTVSGLGTWTVGTSGTPTNANFQLGVNATTNISNGAAVNLSGLSNFVTFLGTGTFSVGETVNSGGTGTANSTITLAANSTINAATITSDSPDGNVVEAIVLGTGTNIFNANTINIGIASNRASGTLGYGVGNTTGTLKIRNEAGTGAAVLNVAYGNATTGFSSVASVVDLTGHSADLLLTSLNVGGRTSTAAAGSSTGVFKFDTGTLSATSVTVGLRAGTTATGNATGDLQLSGGTTTIGTGGIQLGINTATLTGATAIGSLELSGTAVATVGAASSTSITLGKSVTAGLVSTASLSITGTSSLTLSGDLIKGVGAGSANATSTLTLNGGTLDMGGFTIGSGGLSNGLALDVLNFQSGTLKNVAAINTTAGVTKTTSGTLTIAGSNTYAGTTAVNAGTVVVSGSITGSVNVASTNNSVLASGNNTSSLVGGSVTVASDANGGGTLAPGNSSGTLASIGTLNVNGNVSLGSLSTAGDAQLSIELGGTTAGISYDQIKMLTGSTLNLNSVNLEGSLINGFAPNSSYTNGDTFYIITMGVGGTINGTFDNASPIGSDPNLPGFSTITIGGQEFAISYTANYNGGTGSNFAGGGTDVALMAVPEPNSVAMLAGSFGMAIGLQRFRRRQK